MPNYDFELVLSRPLFEPELDALFQRTQGDVTVSFAEDVRRAGHTGHAVCHRQAPSLAAAVIEIAGHVEAACPGLRVLRVDADPLLSMREIAERTGRTAESVRLSIRGVRGAAAFPAAEASTARHRLWRWSHVAAWYGIDDPQIREAGPTAQAVNGWLALRDVVPEIAPEPWTLVRALASAVRASA